jgi:phage terminase large subunit
MSDFKKTATQIEAINRITKSVATDFMIYGSSRSGKSFIIAYILIVRACKVTSDHIVVRNTFNSAKITLFQKTFPDVFRIAFPNLPVEYDKTNNVINFPNGSTIRIAGLDDQQKIERLLGLEVSTCWFNEANQIPYPAIGKLKTRLAQKNSLKKMSFYDQNPTTTTSALYQVFEQGIDAIDGEAFDDETRGLYQSFQMNIQGNLENVDEQYLKVLEKLPEAERKRFLLGEYSNDNNGAAVYAFNRDEHVDDIAIRLEGTDWVGSDFNFSYNSDILASQHAHGLFVHDEIQIEGDTYKKVDALKRKGVSGASIVCDSTGKNRSTKGKSDHIILRDAGFDVRFKHNPSVKDKIANLNRCFTLGLIKINPRCKKLIRDLTQLVWDKNGQLDQKTDPSLSHLVDGLAYLVWMLYPLTEKKKSTVHRY